MKCDASFSQGSVSTLFRSGGHFSYMCKEFLPAYSHAKVIKIDHSYDHKCTATFFRITVYNDLLLCSEVYECSRLVSQFVTYMFLMYPVKFAIRSNIGRRSLQRIYQVLTAKVMIKKIYQMKKWILVT